MPAIETQHLSKSYGEVHSLVDCSLSVPRGSIFGLLGPNGAGKSTLIRILLGFVKPTRGSGRVLGSDICRESLAVRQKVAYLPGDARLYRTMRGRNVLEMFAELHPSGDALASKRVAERLQLDLRRRVGMMSTGMRQKLALAVVLGCQAPLLILDEPTANLDPDVRREVLNLILEANQAGRTIVLSSHLFSDVDTTCDQVAILRSGSLVAACAMQDQPRLHIVRGRLPHDRVAALLAQRTQPFVNHVSHVEASPAQPEVELSLHLIGDPSVWMPWLHELQVANGITDMSIAFAGIEAFYDASLEERLTPESLASEGSV